MFQRNPKLLPWHPSSLTDLCHDWWPAKRILHKVRNLIHSLCSVRLYQNPCHFCAHGIPTKVYYIPTWKQPISLHAFPRVSTVMDLDFKSRRWFKPAKSMVGRQASSAGLTGDIRWEEHLWVVLERNVLISCALIADFSSMMKKEWRRNLIVVAVRIIITIYRLGREAQDSAIMTSS